jgi:hypothetical protein
MTARSKAGVGCLLLPLILVLSACGSGTERESPDDDLLVFERTFRGQSDSPLTLVVDRNGSATLTSNTRF